LVREEKVADGKFTSHHVGIAARDLSKAIPIYKSLFEYKLTSGPFDDPIQNVSVCFLSRGNGDTAFELVAPLAAVFPVDQIIKK
jgi:predicted enzyme related to lactoylglutathione lyase